jgi:hypothetical protein
MLSLVPVVADFTSTAKEDTVASTALQQILNILQAANVEAAKILESGQCTPLARSLLFADGATADGSPLPLPQSSYLGDYLIYYTSPDGKVSAYLTRAQAEVIEDYGDLAGDAARAIAVPKSVQPLGCCTDPDGTRHNNVPPSLCQKPSTWMQGPCGSYSRGKAKAAARVDEPAGETTRDGGE